MSDTIPFFPGGRHLVLADLTAIHRPRHLARTALATSRLGNWGPAYLSIYLSVCLSIDLSIYLSIYQSINLSIYLSIYLILSYLILSIYISILIYIIMYMLCIYIYIHSVCVCMTIIYSDLDYIHFYEVIYIFYIVWYQVVCSLVSSA